MILLGFVFMLFIDWCYVEIVCLQIAGVCSLVVGGILVVVILPVILLCGWICLFILLCLRVLFCGLVCGFGFACML